MSKQPPPSTPPKRPALPIADEASRKLKASAPSKVWPPGTTRGRLEQESVGDNKKGHFLKAVFVRPGQALTSAQRAKADALLSVLRFVERELEQLLGPDWRGKL